MSRQRVPQAEVARRVAVSAQAICSPDGRRARLLAARPGAYRTGTIVDVLRRLPAVPAHAP